jgi:tetratricopeptide (TPR) repeat protein
MKHQAGRRSCLGLKARSSFGLAGVAEFSGLLCLVLLVACIWPSIPGLLAQTGAADFLEIQKLFMRASEAEKAGDLDNATKQYQEILRLRPDMAEIHNKLGFIYFVQNKYPEAIQAFKNALHLKPELFPPNLGLGMSLFRYSAFEEAIPPLKKALALNPTDPQAIFFLGSTYLSLERFEDAVPLFLRFVRISPQDQDGLYALTLAAEQLYVKSYVNLGTLFPDSARAHQVRGQRLAASKKWDEAIAEFQKVLAISPRLEQIHLALGDIYATQGLTTQAKAEYEKELEINPYDPLAQARLEKVTPQDSTGGGSAKPVPGRGSSGTKSATLSQIQTLVQSAQCSKALALMNSVPGNGSSFSFPWQWEVKCFLQLSEFESLLNVLSHVPPADTELLYWKGFSMQQLTLQSYEALARLASDSARTHELAGRLAAEGDDEPTALREFKLAELRDPDLPGIHYAIGHLLMRNRQHQEAVDEFLAELKTDPYNPLVQCELGSTYLELRDPDKGIALLEAGLERRPDLLDARRDLGRAFGQKDNWEKALAQFQLVAASSPTDYSIHMLIGGAYRKLGRMAEAEAEFRKGRELQAADLSKTQRLAKSILNQSRNPSSEVRSAPLNNKEVH